jgi:hypothetical protein
LVNSAKAGKNSRLQSRSDAAEKGDACPYATGRRRPQADDRQN